MGNQKKEFPIVDVCKFLCAYLVVAIHLSPLSSFESCQYFNYGITQYLARIAVPFYFACAGYFLFRKIDVEQFDSSVFRNYIFKILRLLGTWYLLLFVGGIAQLWYLGGLVIAVFFTGILLYYKVPLKKMVILAVVLYIVGLIGDSYYGLLAPLQDFLPTNYSMKIYEIIFGTTRNGIFMGFPFVLIGGVIAKKKITMKPSLAFVGFAVSMIALLFEAIAIKMIDLPKDCNMYAFLLPAVFFLLAFAINVNVRERNIYKKLRITGIIVYFSHLFIYQWVCWGFTAISIAFNVELSNSLINYLLTIVIATYIGIVLEKLSHRDTLNFIKYLWS